MPTPPMPITFTNHRPPPLTLYGGMRGLLDSAMIMAERSLDSVLAIIVDVSGAAARKQGAMSLFAECGHLAGALGGGDFEQRLIREARTVLAEGRARSVHIDVTVDSSHASHLAHSPSGVMQVLLLPLPASGSPLRDALEAACTTSAWLRLRVELGDDPGRAIETGAGEARIGQQLFAFDKHGAAVEGTRQFLRHASLGFAPPPRIVLLGSGSESLAIVRLAHLLGWYAEIIDARPANQVDAASRNVDRLHSKVPDTLPDLLAERHFDAAIIGGHDFEIDLGHLRHLATAGIGYIGLLGPPERRDAFLGRLGDIIATQLEPRLYAPAGLRLGGDGPEATALAIVAQLQYYLAHDVYA